MTGSGTDRWHRTAIRPLRLVVAGACALAAAVAVIGPQAGATEAGCPSSWGSRVDPPPSVTLDTNARGGTGIEIKGASPLIGECYPGANAFYPGAADQWLHVVVVKRKDLALVLNKSYSCPEATAHPSPSEQGQLSRCIGEVKTELGKYEDRDHTNLAIVTSQYDGKNPAVQPPVGMFQALAPALGIRAWNWWNSQAKVSRGTFTAIGVPGELGLGREMVGEQGVPGSGRMVDNLVRDNEGNYGLMPGHRVEFDTHAPGSDPAKGVNVIQVGDHRFTQECPATQMPFGGGLQLVVLDAQTLEGKSYFPVLPVTWNRKHITIYLWKFLASRLSETNREVGSPFSRPTLVFLATCGAPPETEGSLGDKLHEGLAAAAGQLASVGGTRTAFMDAAWHRKPYALVGRVGTGTGDGAEAVGRPLTGTLVRTGLYYNYELETANPLSQTSSGDLLTGTTQLLQTIGRTHSNWPEVADAQGKPPPRAANLAAAIAYIGEKEFDNTPDPRTQYWSYAWNSGAPTHWKGVEDAIGKLSFPTDQQQFNHDDFVWAQGELQKEIEWLIDEHAYMEQRAKPFFSHVLESWSDIEKIAKEIDNEVRAPDKTAEAQVAAFLNFAQDIGEELPVVGKAVGASVAFYKLATEYYKAGNEPIEKPFAVKAGEVGTKLAERMSLAQVALTTDVPNVIASDYQKLRIVGECADNTAPDHSECPFKPKDWQVTPDDQKEAAQGLKESSKVAVYAALLPVKYDAWKLPLSKHQTANKSYAGRAAAQCFYPFAHEPDTGQIAVPQGDTPNNTDYQITALGFRMGRGTIDERFDMHTPEASVTNPLFGTGRGELGINREAFFSRFFGKNTNTELNYPEKDTPTGWDLFLCGGG